MVEIQPEILNLVDSYILLLEKNGFNITEAYLFGSLINGKFDEWSDIDLAVVSEKFDGDRFEDKEKIRGFYRKIDDRLSILPLNKESLDSYFIQKEVIEKGIRVH